MPTDTACLSVVARAWFKWCIIQLVELGNTQVNTKEYIYAFI